MNDSTLLLPDSGPDFLRTLKLAALYSESVHVFTLTKPKTVGFVALALRLGESRLLTMSHKSGKAAGKSPQRPQGPSGKFLEFSREQGALLARAQKEGIVYSAVERAFANIRANSEAIQTYLGPLGSALQELKATDLEWAETPIWYRTR